MNRRTALAIAPVAFLAPLTRVQAHQPESPIMQLFHEWRDLSRAARAHICTEEDEEAELDRLFYDQRDRIEDEIMGLPCMSAADFACKAIVDTNEGEIFSDWREGRLWREARALVGVPDFVAMS